MVFRLRSELSRTRQDYKRLGKTIPAFGFRIEGPSYYRIDGISVECHAINYRITPLQQMKNLAAAFELE